EKTEPVEPELRVGHHLRLRLGGLEDRLELVDLDRAVPVEPLERPRHPLDEHLVDERAHVARAQPDVPAHAVVVSPVERTTHSRGSYFMRAWRNGARRGDALVGCDART